MLDNTEDTLRAFAKEVIKQSRANLTRSNKNASKQLYNSLDYELQEFPNSFSLDLLMEDYGMFQDRGVDGVKRKGQSLGLGNIPNFSFKSTGGKRGLKGMPPPSAFDKWNVRRGREDRDEKGRFLSRKQLNFKTALGVFYYGIKPSLFFTRPFQRAFRDLPDDIIESFGLDVESFLEFTIKE